MLSEGWDGEELAAKGLWIAPIRRFQRGKLVSNENQVEPMTILYPARFGHLVIVRSKPLFVPQSGAFKASTARTSKVDDTGSHTQNELSYGASQADKWLTLNLLVMLHPE